MTILQSLRGSFQHLRYSSTSRTRRHHPWHSVSSTREYERCPRRYRFTYLDRRPPDRLVPSTWRFGSVVHAGLEAAYRQLQRDPRALRLDVARVAAEAIDRSVLEHDLDVAAHRDRAVWHTTRALARDAVHVEGSGIVGVELPLRAPMPDSEGRITGFADLVLRRADGTIEVVDHKVTRYRRSPDDLRDDLQLNLYGALLALDHPDATRIVGTHHYPLLASATTVDLTPGSRARAVQRVADAAASIARDTRFTPRPGEACGHCPWLASCPEGRAIHRRSAGASAAS